MRPVIPSAILVALTAATLVGPQAAAAAPAAHATASTAQATHHRPVRHTTTRAGRYNRDAAVAYAYRYTANGDDQHRAYNPRYVRYGSDCANFGSQVLAAGGLRPSKTWSAYTDAWRRSSRLYQELRSRGYSVTVYSGAQLAGKYTNARPGDVYFFDWGKGLGISHTAVAAPNGPQVRVDGGRTINDGVGSRIVQHTSDRENAAWNVGWIMRPKDVDIRRMKVYVVHVG